MQNITFIAMYNYTNESVCIYLELAKSVWGGGSINLVYATKHFTTPLQLPSCHPKFNQWCGHGACIHNKPPQMVVCSICIQHAVPCYFE